MRRISALVAVLTAVLMAAAAAAQDQPRITRIEFRPATQQEGGGVIISLLGSGRCTYTLDYGDGKTEQRTAQLPDRVQHTYPADGEYDVVATPQAPCEGVARARINLRAINRGIWSLSGEPGPATDALEFIVTVHGQGLCTVTLDLGDGNSQNFEATLPTTRTHKYANQGTYHLKATTVEPCQGQAELRVDIKR